MFLMRFMFRFTYETALSFLEDTLQPQEVAQVLGAYDIKTNPFAGMAQVLTHAMFTCPTVQVRFFGQNS